MCLIFIFNSFLFAKDNLKNSPRCKTVVCIHGFLRSKLSMSMIARSFRKDGFDVLNWGYSSRKRKIKEHAELLVMDLKLISQKKPGQPISFVTHSMGGLVLRSAINNPKCPIEAKMGKIILLAPPNRGSIIARKLGKFKLGRLIFGRYAGRELMDSSNFDYLGNFPPNLPVLVIAGSFSLNPFISGKNDGKVAVDETFLSAPHEHKIIYAGHTFISFNKKAIYYSKKFIKK